MYGGPENMAFQLLQLILWVYFWFGTELLRFKFGMSSVDFSTVS